MNGVALKILRTVAKRGEVSLAAAIQVAKCSGDHTDQYPLALLLEEGYLGMTLNHVPPSGAEEMREFSLAKTLYTFGLPTAADGVTHYQGIRTHGSLDPAKEAVFMKAKGALYLAEYMQKRRDRLWSFVLGLSAGLLAAVAAAWVKGKMGLS